MGGPQKIQNYLLEGGPLVDRLPQLGGCSRNPSVSLWQLALLWEAVLGFSDSFLKTQHMCPFHDGWLPRAPAHTLLSVQQFLPKMARLEAPPSLFTQSHPGQLGFCFPGWNRSSKGKRFANVEEVKQKKAEALKGIKINKLKTALSSGKNASVSVLIALNGEYFEGDWSLNM